MLRPPKSLDAAALASKIKKTKHEFNKMTSEVDAELTKVMERMAERKTWSRLDEVKQEEAVVHAAQAEASRRAAEAQERAANLVLGGSAPAPSTANANTPSPPAAMASPPTSSEAPRLRKELDDLNAEELAQANALAMRAQAKKAASEAAAAEHATPPTRGLFEGGGLFGGLFGAWGGGSSEAAQGGIVQQSDETATGEAAASASLPADPEQLCKPTAQLAAGDSPPPGRSLVDLSSLSPELLERAVEEQGTEPDAGFTPPKELCHEEQAYRDLRKQYKAAERRVAEHQGTGGPALQVCARVLDSALEPPCRAGLRSHLPCHPRD